MTKLGKNIDITSLNKQEMGITSFPDFEFLNHLLVIQYFMIQAIISAHKTPIKNIPHIPNQLLAKDATSHPTATIKIIDHPFMVFLAKFG